MWTFDSQYKNLVVLLNELSNQASSGAIGLEGTLGLFRRFINEQFKTEERLMREMNYRYYETHKAQHDRFLQDISLIRPDELNSEIIGEWAAWWLSHLPFNDRPSGSVLKSVNWLE